MPAVPSSKAACYYQKPTSWNLCAHCQSQHLCQSLSLQGNKWRPLPWVNLRDCFQTHHFDELKGLPALALHSLKLQGTQEGRGGTVLVSTLPSSWAEKLLLRPRHKDFLQKSLQVNIREKVDKSIKQTSKKSNGSYPACPDLGLGGEVSSPGVWYLFKAQK